MGKYGDYDDPAHDADIDELRREQLRVDIGDDEFDDEFDDDWLGDDGHDGDIWPDEDCDIVLDDSDEEDRHWVVVHHQPRS